MAEHEQAEHGVQALIDRIREQAVAAGRREADSLREQAQAEAAAMLEAAKRERDAMLSEARKQIAIEQEAGRAAVQLAARDVMLALEASVVARFEAHVGRLVSDALQDPALMRALVLVLAGRVSEELLVGKDIEVVVSALLDEHPPDEPMPKAVRDGILGLSHGMLREGVVLSVSPKLSAGAKVKLVGQAAEVDLSAAAISEMLLAYLTPRFRALLQGVA
jgi:V/A-type H+-transporting ATPase subunit E